MRRRVARPVLQGLVGWRSHKMDTQPVTMKRNVASSPNPHDVNILSLCDPATMWPGHPAAFAALPTNWLVHPLSSKQGQPITRNRRDSEATASEKWTYENQRSAH